MSKEDLKKTIKKLLSFKSEKEWFEFKDNWYEPVQMGEYISSMSNAAAMCGEDFAYFVWGVQNETHELTDTDFDYHRDVKNEPLQHFLARQLSPDIGFRFEEVMLDPKIIFVL